MEFRQKGSYYNNNRAISFSVKPETKPKTKTVIRLDEENYVDLAEAAIKSLSARKNAKGKSLMPTTSKIRNLLAMTSDIYNDVMNSGETGLSPEVVERINYLKIRTVYEAGRDEQVKAMVDEAAILDHLKEIKKDRAQFIRFCRYMEALVAYHRFYGGKDH